MQAVGALAPPQRILKELDLRRALLVVLVVCILAFGGLTLWFVSDQGGGSLEANAKLRAAEVMGAAAKTVITARAGGVEGTHGSAVELINREIEVRRVADNVHMAVGVGNVTMVTTSEGNVVFDSGLIIQAAEQRKLLREQVSDAPVTHLVLSHSHADHASGAKVWMADGVEVVAHREFVEELRYLKELEPFQHARNRKFFPWMPETAPDLGFLDWGDVSPTITVDDGRDYEFELGGVRFEVLSTPGAEGADNICLWLPGERILLSGDFFGPQFPQFPNIVTLRGEKIRKPVEYIRSLEKIIALKPAMVVPSHFNPTVGEDAVMAALIRTRDAVKFVHDETVAAMNRGDTVYDAMRAIALPPELELPQNHGRVSWAVKSIWEYYASWFHWDTTTELYPVPARDVYGDVVDLAGVSALVARAREHQASGRPVEALHLIEMALASGGGDDFAALEVRRDALLNLKSAAEEGFRNDYELFWLDSRLKETEERIGTLSPMG